MKVPERLSERTRRSVLKTVGVGVAATGLASGAAAADESADAQATPSIEFDDQSVHHGTVYVEEATLPDGGFVALHHADSFSMGDVVGVSAPLRADTYQTLPIEIESLASGTHAVNAVLHHDSPHDGEFAFPDDGDEPLVVDGELVDDFAQITF